MAHSFKEHNPDQAFLLPPSPSDWLADNHKAKIVREIVGVLDMSEFEAGYSSDGRGAPAFSPRMMLSVVVYGWLRGAYSCRKLALLCRDDLGGRYLAGAMTPDFRSLNRFRLRHGKAIEKLYLASVELCRKSGMATLTDLAVDGTRIASYASKSGNIHYGRIAAEESRHVEFLRQARERADSEDASDDASYGEDREGAEIPEAMRSSAGRIALLRAAKAAMEAEAKAKAEADLALWESSAPGDRPHVKKPDPENALPKKTAQHNPVDPESRVQFSCRSGFLQGYNAQAAVDAASQVIVACDLSNCATDVGSLAAMLDQAVSNTGASPERVLADGGYYGRANVEDVEKRGMLPLIPPPLKKGERARRPPASLEADEVAALSPRDRMRYNLSKPEIKALYDKRRQSVEPVFGQIKGGPGNIRFRRFLRLTMEKCRQDWLLLCGIHNIGKYIGWRTAQASA